MLYWIYTLESGSAIYGTCAKNFCIQCPLICSNSSFSVAGYFSIQVLKNWRFLSNIASTLRAEATLLTVWAGVLKVGYFNFRTPEARRSYRENVASARRAYSGKNIFWLLSKALRMR